MSGTECIITTFKRNECLKNLLASMPGRLKARTYVGDQNRPIDREQQPNVKTVALPYDCGLSHARNELVSHTRAPFVLLLEDDFEFTEKTDIDRLMALMDVDEEVGVVGGIVEQNGVHISFEMNPVIQDGVLYHKSDGNHWQKFRGINYKETGCVMNFALFRRELFKDVLWDPELKLREHQDFYLRLRETKWRVLFTPDVVIKDAKPRHTEEYRAFKNRDEFQVMMMRKHNIHKIKYQNGSCRELKDGKIVKYKESPLST